MLERVREIHGNVNKQLTNHSSATEREIAEEQIWFLSSNLVAQLVKSWATRYVRQATLLRATKLYDEVARLCCMSDMGLHLPHVTEKPQDREIAETEDTVPDTMNQSWRGTGQYDSHNHSFHHSGLQTFHHSGLQTCQQSSIHCRKPTQTDYTVNY